MAASQSINKPHFQDPELNFPVLRNPPSKFYTKIFFSKSFIVIIVLVLLPLFPSRAPDFINPTIFTKLWELVYLSFIGTAVSYGLFSRKHEHQSENEASSDTAFTKRYFSWISQISSIFEDGFENSCGCDEKSRLQSQDLHPNFGLGKIGDYVFDEGCKSSRSCIYKYVFKNPFGFCSEEKKLAENCGPCEAKPSTRHKPMKLPIGSLRKSINLDRSSPLSRSVNGSGSSLEGFSDEGERMRNVKGLVPVNLEQKFREVERNDHGSPSRAPSPSASGSMKTRKEQMGTGNPPSPFRPLSVGVFEFECLKTQPVRFSVPSCTNSEKTRWSFFDSFSPEVQDLEAEDSMGKVDTSPSKGGIASLEMFKENLNGLGTSVLHKEKQAWYQLHVNAGDRGRSGRTIRSKGRNLEAKESGKIGMKFEKVGKGARVKNKMTLGTQKGNEQACHRFSDAEPHSGEVDRKADEFIAKFREQIRLQNRVPFRRLNI